MSLDRRTFLKSSALLGGALGVGVLPSLAHGLTSDGVDTRAYRPEGGTSKSASLRILILGGTGFIGPYQVKYALDRGHKKLLALGIRSSWCGVRRHRN